MKQSNSVTINETHKRPRYLETGGAWGGVVVKALRY